MRLPDGHGDGLQQSAVLPAGQQVVVVQQVLVQQDVVQQVLVQHGVLVQQELGYPQQIGCTSALLLATSVGTGQQGMTCGPASCGHGTGVKCGALAAAPGVAITHAEAVAAKRSESVTRIRRIADSGGRDWTGTA